MAGVAAWQRVCQANEIQDKDIKMVITRYVRHIVMSKLEWRSRNEKVSFTKYDECLEALLSECLQALIRLLIIPHLSAPRKPPMWKNHL